MIGLLLARGPEMAPNAPRFTGQAAHVESYFWRANDPLRPRAVWLKVTVLAQPDRPPVAEGWFVWFDGELGRTLAHRFSVPYERDSFAGEDSPFIRVGAFSFEVAGEGSGRGELDAPWGHADFQLRWSKLDAPIDRPLSIFPARLLREGPVPRSKLLTPFPALRFDGRIRLPNEEVDVSGWPGMQGHNWGREHAFEYAWGQCLFPEGAEGPAAMVEGFTARVRLGERLTPRMSALVVRRGEDEYRFDRLLDLWRQEAELDQASWRLRLRGPNGEVRLEMDATDRPMACLGYANPDGHLSYCFNSKLARVTVQVQPTRGGAFELHGAHGGALELLRHRPDPRYPVI